MTTMFRLKAPAFGPVPDTSRLDQWLFLMQHCGLPTLDHRLKAREIVFEGMEGTTGQAAITADKLKAYDDFRTLVEELLGSEAWRSVEAAIWPHDTGLIEPVPEQIIAECQMLTGIDIAEEESRGRILREQAYLKRYGPQRTDGSPPGIYMVANARIGIGRGRDREVKAET